eukprot:scaffold83937_cov66-Phaeocystis_antarctica.AAC.7
MVLGNCAPRGNRVRRRPVQCVPQLGQQSGQVERSFLKASVCAVRPVVWILPPAAERQPQLAQPAVVRECAEQQGERHDGVAIAHAHHVLAARGGERAAEEERGGRRERLEREIAQRAQLGKLETVGQHRLALHAQTLQRGQARDEGRVVEGGVLGTHRQRGGAEVRHDERTATCIHTSLSEAATHGRAGAGGVRRSDAPASRGRAGAWRARGGRGAGAGRTAARG